MRPGGGRRPTRRHQATAGRAAARRQQYGIGSWAASMRRPTRRRCCRRRRRLPAGKLRMRTSKESVSQPREAPATPMPSAGVRLPGRQIRVRRTVPRRRMRPVGGRGPTRRHRATADRAARRQQYGVGSGGSSRQGRRAESVAPMSRPTRRRCCRCGRRLPAEKLRMRTRKESMLQRPRKPLPTPMPSSGVACRNCDLRRYVLGQSAGSAHHRTSRLRAVWCRIADSGANRSPIPAETDH